MSYLTPARYTCYCTAKPISVDGLLDDPGWLAAPRSRRFADIVDGAPAWFDTRSALLWDRDHLYCAFWVEEPHPVAHQRERDSKIWFENDVEFFIAGQDVYYELEINAAGTIYEALWIWRDAFQGGSAYQGRPDLDWTRRGAMLLSGVSGHVHPRGARWGFLDYDLPGLRTAVAGNIGRGWTVEIAIPWASLDLMADGRSLPPREGDVWRIDCSRFQHTDASGSPLRPAAGWTWNSHGYYDSHIPESFPLVTFSEQPVHSVHQSKDF